MYVHVPCAVCGAMGNSHAAIGIQHSGHGTQYHNVMVVRTQGESCDRYQAGHVTASQLDPRDRASMYIHVYDCGLQEHITVHSRAPKQQTTLPVRVELPFETAVDSTVIGKALAGLRKPFARFNSLLSSLNAPNSDFKFRVH